MIELRPIAPGEAEAALAVLDEGFRELWGLSIDDVRARYDPLEDVVDPAPYYAARRGAYLVLADEGRIVGTGGVCHFELEPEVAELRRVWVLKPYRGQGLGRRMIEGLLVFARRSDYRAVRLEVATPDLQPAAVHLYRRLGFRSIGPYRQGPCELAMERRL